VAARELGRARAGGRADLRGADLVEEHERGRLCEPCEREVLSLPAEEQPGAERRPELRAEARQGRPQNTGGERRGGRGRHGRQVREVEVWREVVSVVAPVQVVQVGFV
jgi:hypothetical protein